AIGVAAPACHGTITSERARVEPARAQPRECAGWRGGLPVVVRCRVAPQRPVIREPARDGAIWLERARMIEAERHLSERSGGSGQLHRPAVLVSRPARERASRLYAARVEATLTDQREGVDRRRRLEIGVDPPAHRRAIALAAAGVVPAGTHLR